MPRGLPPPHPRDSTRSRSDMYRETCPEGMGEVEPRPPAKAPPSPLVLVLPISIGLTALVLVAALHAFLGNPLGVGWGVEVWSMVKAAVWPTIACLSLGAYVRAQALAAASRALPPPHIDVEVPRRLSTGGHRVIQVGQGDATHVGIKRRDSRRRDGKGDEA